MALTVVDKAQAAGPGTGVDYSVPFNITLLEGDVVYVWNSSFGSAPAAIVTPGYTLLKTFNDPVFHGHAASIRRKRMGATPDSSVVIDGVGGNAAEAACCFVIRGANASPIEDATTLEAHATSGSPDSPSITTVTDGAMVLTCYSTSTVDLSISLPTNYSELITRAHSNTGAMTLSGAVRIKSPAGAENPPAWTTQTSGIWVAFTVAVRPAPAVTQNLTPTLFSNAQAFQSQTLLSVYNLTPTLYADPDSVNFGHFVSPGPRTLTATLFADGDTFYTQAVTAGARTLTAALYADADTFPTHIVAPAPRQLTATLFSDADTFFTQAVTTGAFTLEAALFEHTDFTFYPASLAVGAVELLPATFENAADFESHSISQSGGTQQIMIMRFRDDLLDAFDTHAITLGAVTLAPDLFVDADTFYDHTTLPALDVQLFTNDATFFTHVLFFGVNPVAFENAPTFFAHVVGSSNELVASLHISSDAFYPHLLEQVLLLNVALFQNQTDFGNSEVAGGAATIDFASFKNANTFYLYNMSNTKRLSAPRGTVYGDFANVRNNDPRTLSPFAS